MHTEPHLSSSSPGYTRPARCLCSNHVESVSAAPQLAETHIDGHSCSQCVCHWPYNLSRPRLPQHSQHVRRYEFDRHDGGMLLLLGRGLPSSLFSSSCFPSAFLSKDVHGRRWQQTLVSPLAMTMTMSLPTQHPCARYGYENQTGSWILVNPIRACLTTEVPPLSSPHVLLVYFFI